MVLSHPTQYYSPWFRWVAQTGALDLRVFYLWEFGVTAQVDRQFKQQFRWDVDLLSGYESEFVPNIAKEPGSFTFRGLNNPTLTARIAAWRPTAVLLFGYKSISHMRAILWARLHGIPLLFRGDSHFLGRGEPSFVSRTVLRLLYAQFSAFLYVGSANRAYFRTLGVSDRKLFFAPHSVNDAHFDPTISEYRVARDKLRRELGLPDGQKVVLYAGKYNAAKQPRELLAAFLAVNQTGWTLVFVGDGEDKTALLEEARSAPEGSVKFLPFANQSEMPSRYLLADLFVLPSRGHYETWGLAINEAMHLGVPALVSELVGCQQNLIVEGQTGWTFRATDAASLRIQLHLAMDTLSNDANRTRIQKSVTQHIAGYTYAQTTVGLFAALGLPASAA